MDYKHNFAEICQQVPFSALFQHFDIPYKKEGSKTLKTDEIVVTEGKLERDGYTFDAFFWKNDPKTGGSVIDFVTTHLKLRNKIKACEWLKTNILGEVEQKQDIPELNLLYDSFFEIEYGMDENFLKKHHIGVPDRKKGVMKERMCFQIISSTKHRGYIGYDYKKLYKLEWYIPKGTKTSDTLYNLDGFREQNGCLILASNPLDASILLARGFHYTLGMFSKNLTEDQLAILDEFKRILVFHPEPDNVVQKLSTRAFVKAVKINSLIGKSADDIRDYF